MCCELSDGETNRAASLTGNALHKYRKASSEIYNSTIKQYSIALEVLLSTIQCAITQSLKQSREKFRLCES
jgi:hypothetical protein